MIDFEIKDYKFVDVASPVGEWEYYKQGIVRCSECHDCYIDEMYITREKWKFCPTCGARLKYERQSEN